MSPDRTTITRSEAIRRRKEEEQNQGKKVLSNNLPKNQVGIPTHPTTRINQTWTPRTRSVPPAITSRWEHRYDIAVGAPYPDQKKAKGFSLPSLPKISIHLPKIVWGPRWMALLLAIFCLADLYLILTTESFTAHAAAISGNNRISTQEIENVLRIDNLSAAEINPAQVETNILVAFPEISSAIVKVTFPNNVDVSVVERTPVAVWQQDGQTLWVDAKGYSFNPRGAIDTLPVVNALGTPINIIQADPKQLFGAKQFLPTSLSEEIIALTSILPEGATLLYDPSYGLGWSDPKGWKVFFGKEDGDNAFKLNVYKSLLDYLTKNNIKPSLISVEYPDAPFYRVEQ